MSIKPYTKSRRISNLKKDNFFWVQKATAANCFIKKGVNDDAAFFIPGRVEKKFEFTPKLKSIRKKEYKNEKALLISTKRRN